MATDIKLIYCAGGNKQFAETAIEAGFLYGAQLPDTVRSEEHTSELQSH